jgi:GT2 family glycosyltransferase
MAAGQHGPILLPMIDRTDPDITVVVVNYNGGDYLKACMASLARQTWCSFETIVVDNASTDGSLERIGQRPEQLTVLRERKNHGFAAGNNLAIRKAKGRWIALLNPDAEAAPDWLENLMRAIRERPSHRCFASNRDGRRGNSRRGRRLLSRLRLRLAGRLRATGQGDAAGWRMLCAMRCCRFFSEGCVYCLGRVR